LPEGRRYPWVEATARLEAATCYFMIGKQGAAFDSARVGADLARKNGYKVLELEGAYYLDGVENTSIATSDAWNHIRAGLAEFWSHPYPADAGQGFYSDLGFAAQSDGLWYCAKEVFKESLIIHSAHQDKFEIAVAHHRLGTAAEVVGDNALAESEYRRASQMLAELGHGADLTRIELEIERADFEMKQNRLQAAGVRLQTVAAQLPGISNHYALIPYLESVGLLHMETGEMERAEGELREAVRLIEQDKSSLSSETDSLAWQRNTSQAYRSLLRLYCKTDPRGDKTLSLLEWYRAGPLRVSGHLRMAPVNAVVRHDSRPAPLPSALHTAPGTALLTWLSFADNTYLFLLRGDELHRLQSRVQQSVLNETSRRFIELCSDPMSDRRALDSDARRLYAWLIQPLSDQLAGIEKLVIEPDDSFSGLPFELLEDDEGQFLGDRFAVTESPALAYAGISRSEARISPASMVLAVGDPALGAGAARFRPLPNAAEEASRVASDFQQKILLTGKAANLENVVRLLPQAEVFHFAGHAIAEGRETGLVLASTGSGPDHVGLLDPRQLAGASLGRLKLVILSGCQTGIAEQEFVDPNSLVRVFLRGGVPSVIASRWQVDSESSSDLMEQLYRNLLDGQSAPRALAAAKRTIRSRPQTAHPYYWAAFSVFGG
jgi:CHAT domain-containing protein